MGHPSSEDEMISLAKLEISKLTKKYENCQNKLKVFLLPKDEADHKNAIIEIRAGTGGLEATLFAYDLFRMYEKVSLKKEMENKLISKSIIFDLTSIETTFFSREKSPTGVKNSKN